MSVRRITGHVLKHCWHKVWSGVTNWKLQLVVFLSTYLLFPILAIGLSYAVRPALGEMLALGIIFVGVLPSTVQSSIAFTSIARGNVPAALCAASVSNLIGIVLTPLLVAVGVESPKLIHGIAFFTAFSIISYLHIVIGELAPKSWAIRKPELLSLWTAAPLYAFYWLMYPAIFVLNASANAILRIAGQGEPGPHHEHHYSREELKLILHSSRASSDNDQDLRVLASAVELGELEVVDWANSREDLIFLELNASLDQVFTTFRRHKYSRYPIFDESKGEFVGVLHIKDLLLHLSLLEMLPSALKLGDLMHPLERVSRHMPLSQLLEQFRQGGAHFALVEEADGKVIGYLTMEDVLEALVGDIQDEHRKAERGILAYQPGKLLVRGDTPLAKVERLLGVDLDHIEAETLAGLIYETLKRMPDEEEVLETDGLRIIVKKMKGPKVVLAKVVKLD